MEIHTWKLSEQDFEGGNLKLAKVHKEITLKRRLATFKWGMPFLCCELFMLFIVGVAKPFSYHKTCLPQFPRDAWC